MEISSKKQYGVWLWLIPLMSDVFESCTHYWINYFSTKK
jgi:hypothetical protein